jgi:regulatory protein
MVGQQTQRKPTAKMNHNDSDDMGNTEEPRSESGREGERNTVRKARKSESVWNSAVWHLTQRDMTESELLAKLNIKTDNQEWIDETVAKLKEYGYLKSDSDFAKQFIERSFSGEYGSGYITAKLARKGIGAAVIAEEIEQFIDERGIDEQAILNERITSYYPELTMSKEKLVNALQKRGYSYQQVQTAIAQHPDKHSLRTSLEIKGAGADLEKEVLKYFRKGKGLTMIRQELRQKKVEITELDSVIDDLIQRDLIDFYTSCFEQLQKKPYDIKIAKEKSKAYAMLSRKGFSSDEIKFAFEEITNA